MIMTARLYSSKDSEKVTGGSQQLAIVHENKDSADADAQTLILQMVADGATKVAIAKAVGVTDMTILSVSQGKTKTFRKMKQLQRVYDRWKAGKLDLSGKRGKKAVEAPVAEETPTEKRTPAGKMIKAKKSKTAKKPVVAEKTKRSGSSPKEPVIAVQTGFQIPIVTEEMVAGVEEQIRRLQAQAKYMRDLISLRRKYGQ